MRTATALLYPAVGAATGAAAGAIAAAGGGAALSSGWARVLLLAASGAVLMAAGAAASKTKRTLLYDCAAGAVIVGPVSYYLPGVSGFVFNSTALNPLATAGFVLFAGAALIAVHTFRYGKRVAVPAVFLAALSALVALALVARFVTSDRPFSTYALSGAIFGAALWGAAGAARKLFGADVEAFRVS
jgi:hypothetical protein